MINNQKPQIEPKEWPDYSILMALYKEANMVPSLIKAIENLDYPRNKLELIFLLEEHDIETIMAVNKYINHINAKIVFPQNIGPQTKPRALNAGLEQCTGEFIVVYDAEDRPAVNQLKEAAIKFLNSEKNLACLQSPLRPLTANGFIPRQFMHEYDLHFGPWLGWLNRVGLPFPLGGTSNHFRSSALKSVGGWDPYNVTEDADLGFRLHANGFKLDLITSPTYEIPPQNLNEWLPQRSRWIKGHCQTIITMTRQDMRLDFKGYLSLSLSLVFGVTSAFVYGPTTLYILVQGLILALVKKDWHWNEAFFLSLPLMAWLSSALCQMLISGSADRRMKLPEALTLPLYWMLQSIAAIHALKQYFISPFHWDKTPHHPFDFKQSNQHFTKPDHIIKP